MSSLKDCTLDHLTKTLPKECLDLLVQRSTLTHVYTLFQSFEKLHERLFLTVEEARLRLDEVYTSRFSIFSREDLISILDQNSRKPRGTTREEILREVLDLYLELCLVYIPIHGNVHSRSTVYYLWIESYESPHPFISNDQEIVKRYIRSVDRLSIKNISYTCRRISLEDGSVEVMKW